MKNKLSITEWSKEDRPREKMEKLGASALSNAELLAILIGSGSTDQSAVELMKDILKDCNNNLNTLGKMSCQQLQKYKGMGPAKAITILAACELGKRRAATKAEERPQMNCAAAIYEYMLPKMQDLDVEEAWALFMNQSKKLIKAILIGRGGISETSVDVRIILREALLCNATIVAFVHNHPSGNIKPSTPDDRLTKSINEACKTMRLFFMDHVIVTDGVYYSYYEAGKL